MKGGGSAKAFLVNGASRWPGGDCWEEGLGPSRQHVQRGLAKSLESAPAKLRGRARGYNTRFLGQK